MLAIASIFFMSIFMRLFQKVLFSCEKPKSIKTIGKSAFNGCEVLKAVVLPDSIKNIKSYAFLGCSRLKLAYLGSGITDIALDAFPSTEGLAFYNGTASDCPISSTMYTK